MHIVFDMAYDQNVAPVGVQTGGASIGQLYVGAQGLLNALETHLGLTARETHHAMRIQGYMESMQSVVHKPEAGFFKASFESDAWSSAKQFLDWRDELVLAGWCGELDDSYSPRLKALALVEQAFPTSLKRGVGDRLRLVLNRLEASPSLQIKSISLCVELDDLPSLLAETFKKLQTLGVTIHVDSSYHTVAQGNLACIQQSMLQQDGLDASVRLGDDAVVLLRPDNEWSAANTLAAWLAADTQKNSDVLLVQGECSDILDQALEKLALPTLGNGRRSAFRSALQIMPLAIANAWSPLSIQSLLSLLALPVSPIPKFAAKLLLGAIQSEPGIGGERWLQAEDKIINIKKSFLVKEAMPEEQAEAEAKQFMQLLNYFLTELRFDAKQGISPKALVEICSWVKQGLKSPALKQSMAQALAQVDSMIALVEHHDKPISRAQVERMLDSVIAEGGQNPDSHAQASAWMSVADAGGITASIDTVVWWNFIDAGQSSLSFWSTQERHTLANLGVSLEKAATVRAREAAQWRRAVLYAGKRLILIAPKKINGETAQLHPLWDEIRYHAVCSKDASFDKEAQLASLEWQGASLNQQRTLTLAGRTLLLQTEDKANLADMESIIAIDKDSIQKPKSLSFSQMSTMLGCPTKWALQYHAHLSSMASLSLPTGNTMIGSLCHKIVEDLYTDESQWNDTNVRQYTSNLFNKRVPQMAAELLEPGRELEKDRYRMSVCDAVDALLHAVEQAGLKVTKTEGKVDGKALDGIPFKGYIDLLLEDADGQTFVIDLKWSGSEKYKKNEVQEGKALQLASYAWMLRHSDQDWAPGAYFMLAQGEILTDDSRFKTDRVIESELSAKDVWQLGSYTWKSLFKTTKQGELEVSGLWDEKELEAKRQEAGLMYVKSPCIFCDFGKLCGKMRGAA